MPPVLRTHVSLCPLCGRAPTEPHATGTDFEYGTTPGLEWSLLRCPTCDVVMLSPCPDESELGALYPSNYYAYAFTSQPSLGYRIKGLLDRRAAGTYLAHRKDGPILDVGCGDGRLLGMFASRGISPSELFGMELDPKAVERARAKGFQVACGRFEDIPYEAGTFGLVIMQQVIEHVVDPKAVLARLFELLRPGAALVIETPNIASWDHWMFSRRHWGGYHIPRHLFLFSRRSMTQLLTQLGYEVKATESLASPSFWVQSVHHALVERGAPKTLQRLFDAHQPSALALAAFTSLDAVGKPLGITSNMRLIAVKP